MCSVFFKFGANFCLMKTYACIRFFMTSNIATFLGKRALEKSLHMYVFWKPIVWKPRGQFNVAMFCFFVLYAYTVIHFVWGSAKYGIWTIVSVTGTLVEAKMCTFTLESTHFIFNKCPSTHDGASAKFSTKSHETDYSVQKKIPGFWYIFFGFIPTLCTQSIFGTEGCSASKTKLNPYLVT